MVLKIWLAVLLLTTLYYGNTLYGDSVYDELAEYSPPSYSYRLNHDD